MSSIDPHEHHALRMTRVAPTAHSPDANRVDAQLVQMPAPTFSRDLHSS